MNRREALFFLGGMYFARRHALRLMDEQMKAYAAEMMQTLNVLPGDPEFMAVFETIEDTLKPKP